MTKKTKQFANSQACGPELTDEELERAVGGIAAVAPNANTLDATSRHPDPAPPVPAAPAGQSLQGAASAGGGARAIAASNGLADVRTFNPLLVVIRTTDGCA